MRPLPLSLWLLIAAQIEARTASSPSSQHVLPTAVRKMPPDQGEKFYHSYCAFPDHDDFAPAQERLAIGAAVAARSMFDEEDARRRRASRALNASAEVEVAYRPPFAVAFDEQSTIPHGDEGERGMGLRLFRRAAEALALLQRRQWACPSGTSSCEAIGYPNSCCPTGEACVEVQDTGLGPVGCCPAGTSCAGGVSGCSDGSTSCGSDIGGGCCISGFVCQGVGCGFLFYPYEKAGR